MSIKIHGDSRKDKIDYTAYAPDAKDLQNFYGLPKHIAFCTKCGISNQRPNSSIEHLQSHIPPIQSCTRNLYCVSIDWERLYDLDSRQYRLQINGIKTEIYRFD